MAELANMRQTITQYTPGTTLQNSTHGYQRVALQLFGMLGHGKSSFINSCVCVVKCEDYQNLSGAGQTNGPLTMTRIEHELTNNLVMIDNRGFNKLEPEELLEACGQLRSLRNMGEVVWEKDNLDETLRQIPDWYTNRSADFIVPVLVYSAKHTPVSGTETLITNAFRITGIHPIVVITKCGHANRNAIEREFGARGVRHRICLENYTENDHQRTEGKDRKILEFLTICTQEAERGIRMMQNQESSTKFATGVIKQIKQEVEQKIKKVTDPLREENRILSEETRILKAQIANSNWCTLV